MRYANGTGAARCDAGLAQHDCVAVDDRTATIGNDRNEGIDSVFVGMGRLPPPVLSDVKSIHMRSQGFQICSIGPSQDDIDVVSSISKRFCYVNKAPLAAE
jgi:hypothetical protein